MFDLIGDYDDLYNTPDGENLIKKLWVATKLTGVTAIGIATADVFLWSYPKTIFQTLSRYAYYTFPMVGIGATFITIRGLSANIRQKDDIFNSGLAGFAAGGVYTAWRGTRYAAFGACILFTASAMFKKHCSLVGFTIMDINQDFPQPGGALSVRYDWTLTKDRPRNWTTGAEASK